MRLRYLPILLATASLPPALRAQTAAPPAPQPGNNAAQQEPDQQQANEPQAGEPQAKPEVTKAAKELKEAAGQQAVPAQPAGANGQFFGFFPQPMEKGAWIGLSVSPAPAALRHQLRLPNGTGLVVDFVQPKSPGQEAGVKQYDLLEKLDDQLLINPEQFAVLVRINKPGDEVKLTLLREGKRQTMSVKLVEREVPRFETFGGGMAPMPPAQLEAPPQVSTAPPPTPQAPAEEWSVHWLDGQREIVIVNRDGRRTLAVFDGNNHKQILRQAIDTPEQRKELPLDVRKVLEQIEAVGPNASAAAPPQVQPRRQ